MIIETAKMSGRGQVIIPKEIRSAIGAQMDTLFAFTVSDDGTVLMRKMDPAEVFRKIRASAIKRDTATLVRDVHAIRALRKK
jgi:bifunctional DNA-binding transcriptional regulator/antitoxin component of YhaV-PrlF toxin-antitoxin module